MVSDRLDDLLAAINRVESKLDMLLDALTEEEQPPDLDLDGSPLATEREPHTSLG